MVKVFLNQGERERERDIPPAVQLIESSFFLFSTFIFPGLSLYEGDRSRELYPPPECASMIIIAGRARV